MNRKIISRRIVLALKWARGELVSRRNGGAERATPNRLRRKVLDPFLAAPPDGLVNDDKIVEIKCLHSVYKKGISLGDAVKSNKNLFLEEVDSELKLKRTHAYYYLIQG